MKAHNRWHKVALVLLGGIIVMDLLFGHYFGISHDFTIIFTLVSGLIFVSWLLWYHANEQATGSEWWQDDTASGWRGY